MSLILVPGASATVKAPSSLAVVRFGRGQAELSRRLGRGCRAALAGLAPDALLELLPDGEGYTRDTPADPLTLTGGFGKVALDCGGRFLRALSGIDLGETDGDDLSWEWQQAAICGRLAGTPFGTTSGLVRGRMPDAGVRLRLTVRSGGHAVSTLASAEVSCWLRLLEAPGWDTLRSTLAGHASLTPDIPFRLARHTLPATAAAALRPGDIVLPSSPAFGVDGRGTLDWGPLRATVAFGIPATLTILALENTMYLPHTEAGDTAIPVTPTGAEPAAAADAGDGAPFADAGSLRGDTALDTLPLTLDFELGRLALNLGQLRCLGRGSIVLLENAEPGAVAIVCGRRRLGSGEVVDVDGRLGVRIVEWGGA